MSSTRPVFTGTSGLNTKVDPVRLPVSEGAQVFLSSCLNVDVDDTGRLSRRKGFTLAQSGSWHSLFPCSGYLLGVKSDGLFKFNGATSTGLRNVTTGRRMSYTKAFDGKREVIYYANGAEVGKVYADDGLSHTVAVATYVGPTTSRVFTGMPIGEHICVWNGRMYVSNREALWYSERIDFESYRLAKNNVSFPNRVNMLIPLEAGLMIGTAGNILLMSGPNPDEWAYRELAQYGAIEWTDKKATKTPITVNGAIHHNAWLFGTQEGMCAVTEDGQFENKSENFISYPSAIRGGAGIFNGKYIMNLEG